MSTTSNETPERLMQRLRIQYLQDIAYIKAHREAKRFKEALEKIAGEQLICRASGPDTTEPALTAQEAQDLARKVLNDNR